MLRVIMSIL